MTLIMTPNQFIAQLSEGAVMGNTHTGIPASVSLAQAALESRWGNSAIARKAKNLFGIKADRGWTGAIMAMRTGEYLKGQYVMVPAKWRAYPSWEGSFVDHADFLYNNIRYQRALAVADNAQAFALMLQTCGYSTDPKYAVKLLNIINGHSLQRFDVPKEEWQLYDWAAAKYERAFAIYAPKTQPTAETGDGSSSNPSLAGSSDSPSGTA